MRFLFVYFYCRLVAFFRNIFTVSVAKIALKTADNFLIGETPFWQEKPMIMKPGPSFGSYLKSSTDI